MGKNKILPTVLQDHRKQQKHSAKITGVQVGLLSVCLSICCPSLNQRLI